RLDDLAQRAAQTVRVRAFEDVCDAFLDAARRDAVLLVELQLLATPPVGFLDRALNRAGLAVGVQNRPPVEVARRAADRLNQRVLRTQEAFLVRVEDRDQ